MISTELTAPALGVAALVAATSGSPSIGVDGIGWLGILATILGAVALYRAGSVRAWKETAEGRAERVEDLERELAELRTELAIPERIEGIIRIMDETAKRAEDAASERLAVALDRVDERWKKHDAAAEARTQRLERGHEATHHELAELVRITKGER